jgi:hypothetical protein
MIELKSARVIQMCSLNQTFTYGGMMEGSFRKSANDALVERIREDYARTHKSVPVVIQPRAKPFEHPEQRPELAARFGPQERLPSIRCYARFSSVKVGEESADGSCLEILWFQETWAMPMKRPGQRGQTIYLHSFVHSFAPFLS